MLMIRMARRGKKNQSFFRLLVSEKTKDLFGDSLENVGTYDPNTKEAKLNVERIVHWLSKGAKASPTVHNLLVKEKVVSDGKIVKKKEKKKADKK